MSNAYKASIGPWKENGTIVTNASGNAIIAVTAKMRQTMNLSWQCDSVASLEAIANARVIAAAPGMLAACRLALALVKDTWIYEHGSESVGNVWGALAHAIDAATGEKTT